MYFIYEAEFHVLKLVINPEVRNHCMFEYTDILNKLMTA